MAIFSHSKKEDFTKEIRNFQKNLVHSKDPKKKFEDLCKIINNVFAEKFNVLYKFTYEDLKVELRETITDPEVYLIRSQLL